jgi:hypothetical protein
MRPASQTVRAVTVGDDGCRSGIRFSDDRVRHAADDLAEVVRDREKRIRVMCADGATLPKLVTEFSGLVRLRLDIRQAQAFFERLAEMPDPLGDFRLSSALWVSGILAYRRCFTDGNDLEKEEGHRLIPQRFIDALDPEQRELHVEAMHFAERNIQHRVSDHHDVEVWFEIEHGPPPRVRNVQGRRIMFGARTHNAFEFAALVKHFADELDGESERVKREILAAANESDIASWFTPTSESPEWVNVLAGNAGPIFGDGVVAQMPGENRSAEEPGEHDWTHERGVDERRGPLEP